MVDQINEMTKSVSSLEDVIQISEALGTTTEVRDEIDGDTLVSIEQSRYANLRYVQYFFFFFFFFFFLFFFFGGGGCSHIHINVPCSSRCVSIIYDYEL